MRSVLLASAALIMSTGFALAQTTTSAPAPTGAPNAPAATSASPGNMAPSSASGQNTMAPASGISGSSSSTDSSAPAPTGAPNAAPAAPGASPGNLAPAAKPDTTSMVQPSETGQASGASPDQTASNTAAIPAPVTHHHSAGMHMASLPASANARAYLQIAKMAIRNHQMARADDALSHAETRLLTRSVPSSTGSLADDSPAVTSIEHARSALSAGNYTEASSDTGMAMQQAHGDIGAMSNASDTSTP